MSWRLVSAAFCFCLPAAAATVQGNILLPEGFQTDVDNTPSLWLLENGVVPIRPPLTDPRTHMAVVLEGGVGASAPPARVVVELADMQVTPRIVPIGTGGTVEFHNEDRVAHSLYVVDDERVPRQPQAPGATRTVKFASPGVYVVRCQDFPHVRGTVLVLPSGRYAVPKAGGAFVVDDVPAGAYTLRVWYAGKNIYEQPLDVQESSANLVIKLPPSKSVRGK